MATDLIKEIESRYLKTDLPDLNPGDTVKVKIKIKEGNKERTQAYEGVIIKKRGAGINKTITVRRVFQGIGVERVFLLHSPKVEGIQIIRRGDVRRAKLYYLRNLTGKAARIREKIVTSADSKGKGKGKGQAQPQPQAQKAVEAPAAVVVEPTTEPTAE